MKDEIHLKSMGELTMMGHVDAIRYVLEEAGYRLEMPKNISDGLVAHRKNAMVSGGEDHAVWCHRIYDSRPGQIGGCVCRCQFCGEILDDPEDMVYGHCDIADLPTAQPCSCGCTNIAIVGAANQVKCRCVECGNSLRGYSLSQKAAIESWNGCKRK